MSEFPRSPAPPIEHAKPMELRIRGDFLRWLSKAGGMLAVTTYNSGKLALFRAASGRLQGSFWHFPRPMGLAYQRGHLALATYRHIWLFQRVELNDVTSSSPALARDRVQAESAPPGFTLAAVFSTGRLDAHDLAFAGGKLLFANTRFNCVAGPSTTAHFRRAWTPSFVESRVRGDRCHLNGVGVRSGRLNMATAFCDRDTPEAWRSDDRFQSGVLVDVRKSAVALRGLCLPHSPRWHAGRWWFCDSGRGGLCTFDPESGASQSVATLPGFTRGLHLAAGRAVVGLSRIRSKHVLDAPPIRELCSRTRSGLWLVDPGTGVATGSLEFLRGGREVYDVVHIPDLAPSDSAGRTAPTASS